MIRLPVAHISGPGTGSILSCDPLLFFSASKSTDTAGGEPVQGPLRFAWSINADIPNINTAKTSDIVLNVRQVGVGSHKITLTVTNTADRSHTVLHMLQVLNSTKVPVVSTSLSTERPNNFYVHEQIGIGTWWNKMVTQACCCCQYIGTVCPHTDAWNTHACRLVSEAI